jgi:hypothetical protein
MPTECRGARLSPAPPASAGIGGRESEASPAWAGRFTIHGIRMASELPLPGLTDPDPDSAPAVSIRLGAVPASLRGGPPGPSILEAEGDRVLLRIFLCRQRQRLPWPRRIRRPRLRRHQEFRVQPERAQRAHHHQ